MRFANQQCFPKWNPRCPLKLETVQKCIFYRYKSKYMLKFVQIYTNRKHLIYFPHYYIATRPPKWWSQDNNSKLNGKISIFGLFFMVFVNCQLRLSVIFMAVGCCVWLSLTPDLRKHWIRTNALLPTCQHVKHRAENKNTSTSSSMSLGFTVKHRPCKSLSSLRLYFGITLFQGEEIRLNLIDFIERFNPEYFLTLNQIFLVI